MLGIRRVYAGTTPGYTRDLNRRSTKNTPNAPPKTLQKVMIFMIGSFTRYPPDYTPLYAGYTPCYQIDYVYAQGIRRYTPGIRHAVKTHRRKNASWSNPGRSTRWVSARRHMVPLTGQKTARQGGGFWSELPDAFFSSPRASLEPPKCVFVFCWFGGVTVVHLGLPP